MTDPIFVTLTSDHPALTVRAIRGDGAPIVTGGYGGWEQIARPRNVALTRWTGSTPLKLQLPLLFDGFRDDRSVEPECATLEAMALSNGAAPPPRVTVSDGVPHAEVTWVVDTDGLEWTDAIWHEDGFRLRQTVTVTLLEYVAVDQTRLLTAAERIRAQQAASQPGIAARIYYAKEGDTLGTIAAQQLHDYSKYRDLMRLNGIRDPDNVHAGQLIRLG